MKSSTMCRSTWVPVLVLTFLVVALPAGAEVKRIVIDRKVSPAFDGRSYGSAGQYETLAGRAFGELDPNDPHNRVITDIHLAPRNRNGRVEYVASFFIVKPIDMTRSSRLMWHDVPNRAGRVTIPEAERALGDIGLSSGWQGDSAGNTVPGDNNDYAIVPVAKNPDGSPITGLVMGRIVNASGLDSRQMIVHSNPVPYRPVTLDTSRATLTTHASESIDGTGFPSIPGVPATAPTGLINPLLDYDWGPEFNYVDGSGVSTKMPPEVKRVIRMKVPRVDADGNELGGVPVVLREAPLGTYLGWNITAEGFHQGKICNYAGGMIPFAATRAERLASGDPRLSVEERYGTHAGYVDAVRAAAAKAVGQGFLLQADADALIAQAAASSVLATVQTAQAQAR